jgi:hypothetical protein
MYTATALTQAVVTERNLSNATWAERIAEAWQKQVPAIFETGSLLESAKAELRRGDFMKMVKADLPFSQSTTNKLIKIATCDHLRNSEHVPNLPAHWGTLFELTLLTEEQFEKGIKSGAINLKMQRKDVQALRGGNPKTSTAKKSNLRDQLAEAVGQIQQLKKNGGDLFGADDTPKDIAKVLFETLTPNKFEKLIGACRELHAGRKRQEAPIAKHH